MDFLWIICNLGVSLKTTLSMHDPIFNLTKYLARRKIRFFVKNYTKNNRVLIFITCNFSGFSRTFLAYWLTVMAKASKPLALWPNLALNCAFSWVLASTTDSKRTNSDNLGELTLTKSGCWSRLWCEPELGLKWPLPMVLAEDTVEEEDESVIT